MSAEILEFNGATTLDIPVEKVLQAAFKVGLSQVFVIGECEDGSVYYASSGGYKPDLLWMLKQAEMELLRGEDEE